MADRTQGGGAAGSTVTTFTLGGYNVVEPRQLTTRRFTMLLWGSAGCGKTTLAATAPGRKLYIQFDPGGAKVIAERQDCSIVDLSAERPTITDKLKLENPLGIERYVKEQGFDTVIIDSLSTLANLCLENGISSGRYTGATLETPGLQAYGHRNSQLLEIVKQFFRATGRTNTNLIFIAHEDRPEKDSKGNTIFITIMLGGSLPEYSSLHPDEVWWMQDTGKDRKIAIRPIRMRKPMKSRMFKMTGEPEFILRPNASIAQWYEQYTIAGHPIDIPT